MAKPLEQYERKRDFGRTPEPQGGSAHSRDLPRFVVQQHSATRLHWDLRLEHEGVAASWAVPNGIPFDPKENRLAVHTEDHPLEYLEFEGTIPEGNYGAGEMSIWDAGTYEPEKFRKDEVIAVFHGERVRGRYALFQTKGQDWMIHRMDPAPEGREPMPERIEPMLAKLGGLPRDPESWAAEIKWDGVRAIAYLRPGRLRLESRNEKDLTAQFPEIRRMTRAVGAREMVLDGELVAFDDEGKPSFARLQRRLHHTSESTIRRRAKELPVTYVIFDLLHLDGEPLLDRPYEERREALEGLELSGPSWQTPEHVVGRSAELLEASRAQGLEGLVLKRLGSTYKPGNRGGDWLKVKNVNRQEVVIGGWTGGEGRRSGTIGALLVGFYDRDRLDDEGMPELLYAGRVGTGFDRESLELLESRFEGVESDASPFANLPKEKGAHWLRPELVAEVEFREWTNDGVLRHPSFKGLREDRSAAEVAKEVP